MGIKLKENSFNGYTTYKVSMFNVRKEGLGLEDEIRGKIPFEPYIVKAGDKYKNGNIAPYNSVKCMINVHNINDFDNIKVNEYGSAQFDLPNSEVFIDKLKKLWLGNTIRIFLKEVESTNKKGEKISKTMFDIEKVEDEEPSITKVEAPTENAQVKPTVLAQVILAVNNKELNEEDLIEVTLTDESKVQMKVKDVMSHIGSI